ncbi:hypothetical protein ACTXT7_017051 [Hymenolepis weldensis]
MARETTIVNECEKTLCNSAHKSKTRDFRNCKISKVARSSVCEVRKELLNENNGDELAATRKRKQHYERSADSLRTSEFIKRVHSMMEGNHGKSMRHLAEDLEECLRFFSDENNFHRDEKVNRRNDGWLAMWGWADPIEIPTIVHAHEVSSNGDGFRCCCYGEGHIMTPPFFPQGLGVNAAVHAYVETLQIIVVL